MVIGLRFNNQACFFDVGGNLEGEELSKYYLVRTLPSSVPRPLDGEYPIGGIALGCEISACDLTQLPHSSEQFWPFSGDLPG